MSELKDCPPLKYYDFKPVEHVKVCPRYTAVLGRSEDDGIGIEELDTLQLELETLLSSASRRLRALEEQRQVRKLGPPPQLVYVVSGFHPKSAVCDCESQMTTYIKKCHHLHL